jgi:hypothetical protein
MREIKSVIENKLKTNRSLSSPEIRLTNFPMLATTVQCVLKVKEVA